MEKHGDAPDLMVYLDNLDWRPAGTIGWSSPYLEESDRGPDDMVHDWHGVLRLHDAEGTIFKTGMEEASIDSTKKIKSKDTM